MSGDPATTAENPWVAMSNLHASRTSHVQSVFASTAANISTATASLADTSGFPSPSAIFPTDSSWQASPSLNISTPTSSTSSVISLTSAFNINPNSLTTSFVKPLSTTTSSASQVISPFTPTAPAAQVVCPSTNHVIIGLGAGLGIPLALILVGYLMFLAWWHGRHSHDLITSADTNIQPRVGASLHSSLFNQQAATDRQSRAPSAARSIAELAAEREAAELEARSAKHRCRCREVPPSSGAESANSKESVPSREVAPSSGVGSAESKELVSL